MALATVASWIESTPPAQAIKESFWLFPSIETVHVFALALVFGTIAMVDLRILGFVGRGLPVTRISREVLPWTWIGFAVAAVTGLLLFSSNAERYVTNLPLLVKLGLIALAGLNMAAFHVLAYRSVSAWDEGTAPVSARLFCAVSLILWITIITLGRWIGFV